MTDEALHPQPPRQRRRWIIASGVLCVTVIAWWCWPRAGGDRRLAGKWLVSTAPGVTYADLSMDLDGRGSLRLRGIGTPPWAFKWETNGSRLMLGGQMTQAEIVARKLAGLITGGQVLEQTSTYDLKFETGGEVGFKIPLESRTPGCPAWLSFEGRLIRAPQ